MLFAWVNVIRMNVLQVASFSKQSRLSSSRGGLNLYGDPVFDNSLKIFHHMNMFVLSPESNVKPNRPDSANLPYRELLSLLSLIIVIFFQASSHFSENGNSYCGTEFQEVFHN